MGYVTIGNTIAEWDDNEPLIFTLSDETGSKDDRRRLAYEFNLTHLRAGFEEEFLLNFKSMLIEYRSHVCLRTIKSTYENVELIFRKVIENDLLKIKVLVIDDAFLLALNVIIDDLSKVCMETLRRIFNSNPHSSMFAKALRSDNFPIKTDKKGAYGRTLDSILAKALTRAACVEILSKCEEAYEDGKMDIGYFSFINLAFSVFVRPDSYRRIRLHDLVNSTVDDAFFIYIPPAKSGVHQPEKICYRINKNVGTLLLKQRQQVIAKFGHLVGEADIGKLSLFPARKLKADKSGWLNIHSNKYLGEIIDGIHFTQTYFKGIRDKVLNGKKGLHANALRHTVGTQLAEMGCSAKTIQAVLKHAGEMACMAYVDIAFHGLIGELSDAMEPAFELHFPVFKRFRSKDDLVDSTKAVFSEDLETGRMEFTGECGKQIRCQAAPFTCYECNKFIPCFDADHNLNMDIIQREIDSYKRAGTPYRNMIDKAKSIKYRIQLVMAACDRYQQAVTEQEGLL